MPMAFLRGTCRFLDAAPQKHVVAFLPDSLLEACKDDYLEHERLCLRPLDRIAFKEAMSRCGMLICQAGLYTPFEAMKMGVPFALIYPMSFTQDRQGVRFLKMAIKRCQVPWIERTFSTPYDVDIEVIESEWFISSTHAWEGLSNIHIQDSVASFLKNLESRMQDRALTGFWFSRFPNAHAVIDPIF